MRAVRDRPEGCGSASGAAGGSSTIAVAVSSHQDTLSKHEGDYSCLIKKESHGQAAKFPQFCLVSFSSRDPEK